MPAPTFEQPTRDAVTTIRTDGSRPFLFPADSRGRFTRARRISALGLIVFYLSLPWITINGHPAVFLDVVGRRFHLFGVTLAAQDLWLLFFVISGLGFSLFFVTALLGRVWCGWACPQTVFLDHVYRRIERWIDGDAVKRRALARAPLSAGKITKRVVKHAAYILVSAVITHLFLAYYVSLPEVWAMVSAAPAEHWGAFAFITVATGALYFNFAWFREQLCIVICPYGRIQSALIDDHSLVIGYDSRRGDPPSPRLRKAGAAPSFPRDTTAPSSPSPGPVSPGVNGTSRPFVPAKKEASIVALARGTQPAASLAKEGDCVDCTRCVQVCPTGIDIRQGLQMECIGCTACIDACDEVMLRLNRPRGLIRYDSQKAFAGGRTRWWRARTVVYGVLLLAGASVTTWALSTVKPANAAITRMTGAPYIVDDGAVRNQFLVRIVNKRSEPARFTVRLRGAPTDTRQIGIDAPVEVGPLGEVVQPLVVQQRRSQYTGPFHFAVRVEEVGGQFKQERAVEFLGPEARLLREEEAKR